MGRPREFEVDEAAQALLDVFWAKGYEGASLSDIEAATRLKKQSLYRVFHSKRGMYLAALAAYDRDHVAAAGDILGKAADARAGFAALLNGVVDSAIASGDRRGCFLCNASVDQAPLDPETSAGVSAMVSRLGAHLRGRPACRGRRPRCRGRPASGAQDHGQLFRAARLDQIRRRRAGAEGCGRAGAGRCGDRTQAKPSLRLACVPIRAGMRPPIRIG